MLSHEIHSFYQEGVAVRIWRTTLDSAPTDNPLGSLSGHVPRSLLRTKPIPSCESDAPDLQEACPVDHHEQPGKKNPSLEREIHWAALERDVDVLLAIFLQALPSRGTAIRQMEGLDPSAFPLARGFLPTAEDPSEWFDHFRIDARAVGVQPRSFRRTQIS